MRSTKAILLSVFLLISTGFSQTAASGPPERSDSLSSIAISIRSIEADDEDFSDLLPLKDKIGNSRIVVLGEATHGEGTTYRAKTRLARFLHSEMGFDVLAWETGLLQTYAMNTAMRRSDIPLWQAKRYLMAGGWASAADVHPLFEYVRASWQRVRPLEMAGFDTGKPAMAAAFFKSYLRAAGEKVPALALTGDEWKAVESLTGRSYGFFGSDVPDTDTRAKERGVLEKLLTTIHTSEREIEKSLSNAEVKLLERFLLDALKCEEIEHTRITKGSLAWNKMRDRFMADNLLWLKNELYRDRKIIVWAATSHLIRNSSAISNPDHPNWYTDDWEAGNHLYPELGEDLYTIAFTSYGGTIGDVFPEGSAFETRIEDRRPAPDESFEAAARGVGKPYLFVDLRGAPKGHWLTGEFISISLGGLENKAPWSKIVDAFFFIEKSVPVRYLPRETE